MEARVTLRVDGEPCSLALDTRVTLLGRAADAELAVARPLAGNAFKTPLARAALIAVMRELITEAAQ